MRVPLFKPPELFLSIENMSSFFNNLNVNMYIYVYDAYGMLLLNV
jgi:hypothetical protein